MQPDQQQYTPPELNQAPQQPWQPPLTPSKPPRDWRGVLIAAAIGVLIIGGGAVYWFTRPQAGGPTTGGSVINDLKKPSLSAADVQAINKSDAFYAYLKQAAQQRGMILTKDYYFIDDDGEKDTALSRVGVDYQTKSIVLAIDTPFMDSRDRLRCYDGKQDSYNSIIKKWSNDIPPTNCSESRLYNVATDGFNAGGLTESQAETFVSYLKNKSGLIDVKSLELADHKGTQYLHFSATLNPIQTKGSYLGAQWLMFAFKETGLDPFEYPYGYAGAGEEGFDLEYYVDPATSLPAYSELTSIAPPTSTSNRSGDYHYRITYDFTASTFDATPANTSDITLNW